MKAKRKEQFPPSNFYIYVVLLIALFGFISVMTIYFFNFNGDIGNQEVFGQFGDFIGGVLNPIFSFLTICLLIASLIMQRIELSKVVEELELAREVHITSVNMKHYEFLLSHLLNDGSEFKLAASIFAQKMDESVSIILPDNSRMEVAIFELLSEPTNLEMARKHGFEIRTSVSPTEKVFKFRPIEEKFEQLNDQLVTLSEWIKKLENLGCPSWRAKEVLDIGSDIIIDYYNSRTAQFKTNLEQSLPAFGGFRKMIVDYPTD
ncbi:MAG: hypothetical protein KKH44_11655 [Bacteroidetes bacterium]|nr:hypothetical protein [Bacteroidota bacterium]